MNNAMVWLNDLMVWLGRWIPRLLLIPATHIGIRFGPSGGARAVGPGLVVYWPISHSVLQIPVTTQSMQLASQMVSSTVSGGVVPQVVICAVAVQYRVVDAVKAATKALHFHALVDNRTSASIAKYSHLKEDVTVWMDTAAKYLRSELKEYGIELERLDLTQNGVGVALKNISDAYSSFNEQSNGKSPFLES